MPIKLDFGTKKRLMELLLACPSISNEKGRHLLLAELPSNINNAINTGDNAKIHILNTVNVCIEHDGGLESFIEILEFFDGSTNQFQKLDSFPRSCVGMHTFPLTLLPSLGRAASRNILIEMQKTGNGLLRPAETPSEIRMHSHAGAWEREKPARS